MWGRDGFREDDEVGGVEPLEWVLEEKNPGDGSSSGGRQITHLLIEFFII